MFLASLIPLLKGSSSVTATVSTRDDGTLIVLITSTLAKIDKHEDDPAVAGRKAALALPLQIMIPANVDPDAALASALVGISAKRGEVVDQLTAYIAVLDTAESDAKAAAAAKAAADKAKSSAKSGAKAPKSATKTSGTSTTSAASADEAADDEEGADDDGEEAATPPATPAGPVPEAASSLFD